VRSFLNTACRLSTPVFGVISIFLLTLIGCQQSPNTAFVSGVVTVNGEPRQGVTLMFTPKSGERAAVGVTDELGKYSLRFTQNAAGCIPGLSTVRLTAFQDPEDPTTQYIPQKYNDKAPDNPEMNIEIKKGRQIIDFNVKIDSSPKSKKQNH